MKIPEFSKEVVTDGNPTYWRLIAEQNEIMAGKLKERNWTTTLTVENEFSLFKRAIVENYLKPSLWHLDRHMREFYWRSSRRRMQSTISDLAAISMVNRVP